MIHNYLKLSKIDKSLRLTYTQLIQINRGGVEDTTLEAKDTQKKNRGQGQGQPFRGPTLLRPRTGMLEAKDQEHRRKRSPKKKGLQKFFSGDLQIHWRTQDFDWGRPKPQIACNNVIKIFPKRKFLRDKDIVGWKI